MKKKSKKLNNISMKIFFKSSLIATSSKKANLIVGSIRRKMLNEAVNLLFFFPNRVGKKICKLLQGIIKKI